MPDPRDAKIERLERENDRLRKDLHDAEHHVMFVEEGLAEIVRVAREHQ